MQQSKVKSGFFKLCDRKNKKVAKVKTVHIAFASQASFAQRRQENLNALLNLMYTTGSLNVISKIQYVIHARSCKTPLHSQLVTQTRKLMYVFLSSGGLN